MISYLPTWGAKWGFDQLLNAAVSTTLHLYKLWEIVDVFLCILRIHNMNDNSSIFVWKD